ncbi:phosphoribosyltransferase family protein [uncultured Campylobacter sp.]|uniref:phosphoribosyltransferase family protein n=1 Tax=uncultured Campylobacter sp. TaxID=218934 RepID=UPI00261F642C|nr:phosphoribosyltransferase family protein [uncultured Campylobacter sp.]
MVERKKLMFKDQLDAAAKLYDILPTQELIAKKPILLCSSLDSIIIADFIAKRLKLSYEILFSEKIFAPQNSECIIAMVSETEEIVMIEELVEAFDISYDYIFGESFRKYEEKILKNIYKYRKGRSIESLKNRHILLIDDGCETGITALVCIKTTLGLDVKSISYATPMIASDVLKSLKSVFDQIYAVNNILNFVAVDFYYENKIPFNPEESIALLEESPYYLPLQKEGETHAV